MPESPVRELRLALTVERYEEAVAFYRDVLGLPVVEAFEGPGGGGVVLDAGRATLELLAAGQAELVDEIEVGARVAGPVRVALEVADSAATARRLGTGSSSPSSPCSTTSARRLPREDQTARWPPPTEGQRGWPARAIRGRRWGP
ncbi:MAG: glyoxalase [Actinomycetia bacterium]|nr:glyoxalase [Actinomycetes bacterium]